MTMLMKRQRGQRPLYSYSFKGNPLSTTRENTHLPFSSALKMSKNRWYLSLIFLALVKCTLFHKTMIIVTHSSMKNRQETINPRIVNLKKKFNYRRKIPSHLQKSKCKIILHFQKCSK